MQKNQHLPHPVLWLPATFWHDHNERDLPAGELVRESGNRVLVRVTAAELAEIKDDAEFYAHPLGPDAIGDGGKLKASARRTVAAIEKAVQS